MNVRILILCMIMILVMQEKSYSQYNSRIRFDLSVTGESLMGPVSYQDNVQSYQMPGRNSWRVNHGSLTHVGLNTGIHYLINNNISVGISFNGHLLSHETYYSRPELTDILVDSTVQTFSLTMAQTANINSYLLTAGITGRYTFNPAGRIQPFGEIRIANAFFMPAAELSNSFSHEDAFYNGYVYYPQQNTYEQFYMNEDNVRSSAYPEKVKNKLAFEFRGGLSFKVVRTMNLVAGFSYFHTDIDYNLISALYVKNDVVEVLEQTAYPLKFTQPFFGLEWFFGKGSVKYAPNSK